MSYLLLDLPMWLVGVIIIGGSLVLAFALVYGLRPFVARHTSPQHNQVYSDTFGAFRTMYAIIAGLLVFGVFNTFDTGEQIAANESSALLVMYHDAREFPSPERQRAEAAIITYTRTVISSEWPAMANGKESRVTRDALNRMYHVWGPMDPTTKWHDQYTESSNELTNVARFRTQRLLNSGAALPDIYWFLLLSGALVTVLFGALFRMDNLLMHAIAVGLMTLMLAIVLFLLVEVNHPYRGEIKVSPEVFHRALQTMAETGP